MMNNELRLNSCVCCGEIYANCNLVKIGIKHHTLLMCPDCANDFIDTVNDSVNVEFEKLKKEIKVIHDRHKIKFQGYSMSVAQECIDVIDNRISELKGENNEDTN